LAWRIGNLQKEQSHTTKDELQGRAFDNQNLLSFAILRLLIFYLSVRFSVLVAILTGNALTGIIGKVCADVVFFLTIVNYEWMKSKNHFLNHNWQQ
jgi:hypothetical protein